jgi:hypothetical protein
MAVVGKELEHTIEQLYGFCGIRLRHRFDCSRSGQQFSVPPTAAIRIAARSRQNDRLNQRRIVVPDVADERADRPRNHPIRRVGD